MLKGDSVFWKAINLIDFRTHNKLQETKNSHLEWDACSNCIRINARTPTTIMPPRHFATGRKSLQGQIQWIKTNGVKHYHTTIRTDQTTWNKEIQLHNTKTQVLDCSLQQSVVERVNNWSGDLRILFTVRFTGVRLP